MKKIYINGDIITLENDDIEEAVKKVHVKIYFNKKKTKLIAKYA